MLKPGELYLNRSFDRDELLGKIELSLAGIEYAVRENFGEVFLVAGREKLFETLSILKEKLDFNYLKCLTAADYVEYLEIIYCLYSFSNAYSLTVKSKLDAKNPEVQSVFSLWQGADWHEREAFDLFGINFIGHPNLKKLVLWDGFDEHPLRKSFALELPGEEGGDS
ncbi:MAG: NADH-quinone oxidoreductase subunit C [Actinobacteria bacterium]|nr:NADH-quinone oxidoreductase subunit C [Actinomycetota bacterium]